ncbi:hypothetical protein LH459_06790 [Laribacter hongkongensis]|nr:hypothetical protein [Laribacter hongkongensis]MCG9059339.1 hypothetical protein [Laribacter hongkongensis]MCG9067553.1 hypothetical protein [Laribacter hongkongensis]MCG9080992.1 hypothetical protein [Laribacter hongkongensis]MCG9086390.1 hypothetical protein [Laribacter hongkongensis]
MALTARTTLSCSVCQTDGSACQPGRPAKSSRPSRSSQSVSRSYWPVACASSVGRASARYPYCL